MKERTAAAMSWLDSQIAKARLNSGMTTIKLSKNGRLSPDTIADAFRKALLLCRFESYSAHWSKVLNRRMTMIYRPWWRW